jgi:hypothetical protein
MAFAGSARAALSLNAVGLAFGASGSSRDLSSVASATVPVHRLSSSHAHGIRLPVIKSIGAAPGHHASTCTVQATIAAAPAGSKAAAQDEGRVYNFAAGPACLPYNVLKEAQADLINWKVGSVCWFDQPGSVLQRIKASFDTISCHAAFRYFKQGLPMVRRSAWHILDAWSQT